VTFSCSARVHFARVLDSVNIVSCFMWVQW